MPVAYWRRTMTPRTHPQTVTTFPTVLLFSMDERGRLLSSSPSWADFTGASTGEWLDERWMSYVHADEREDLERDLRTVAGRQPTLVTRLRMRRADGQYRQMHMRAFGLPGDGGGYVYSGLMLDTSDLAISGGGAVGAPRAPLASPRHESTEAGRGLASAARRLSPVEALRGRRSVDALLAASPDAMALVDCDGHYVHVNDELARLTGVSRRDLIGRRMRDFYPDIWEGIERYFSAATAMPEEDLDSDEFEVTIAGSDGGNSEMLVRVYPVTGQQERLLGLGVSLTDITTHKRAERALREANALKDEFLSIASHELRNPVAAVRGSAQLLVRSLKRGALDEQRLRTHLDAILRASEHLAVLTGDLLDVSRLQRGQFPIAPRRADLRALTERVVASHVAGHRCSIRAADGILPAYVDPSRFEQILDNLLDNARKYAPGSSPIEIDLGQSEGGVLVRVRDRGMGLPPGALEEIFKPFGRAPNAIVNNVPGLGLGLYICRRIAEQTGGRLWAESDGEGTGTAVLAWFPCEQPAESGSVT